MKAETLLKGLGKRTALFAVAAILRLSVASKFSAFSAVQYLGSYQKPYSLYPFLHVCLNVVLVS